MASGAAADGVFWSVYEGCISGYDNCIERRPYHRNCGCALHKKQPKNRTHKLPRCNNVSYPMKRACSEGSLVLAAAAASLNSSSSTLSRGKSQQSLLNLEEEKKNNHDKCFLFKV